MPIPLRTDFAGPMVRAAARKSKDGAQARRLLALAAIYEGASRTEAARIGGVTVQIIRDWVVKFNAYGPPGLIDRKAPGQPSRLNAAHREALCRDDRERANAGRPWRCPLAADRPGAMALGRVRPVDLEADLEPGAAGARLPQAYPPAHVTMRRTRWRSTTLKRGLCRRVGEG